MTPTFAEMRTVARDLVFPECPRWHDGALWFSDQHDLRVARLDPANGAVETVVEVPGHPSGLGWLPNGRLLVVSMHDRRVLRLEPGGLVEHADLSAIATGHCNDMLVDEQGRAYVGDFGYDLYGRAPQAPGRLTLVTPDGAAWAVADDLAFPNGTVLTTDGRLVVNETLGQRMTAFTVGADGSLHDRQVFAEIPGQVPDGSAIDASGAIWIAAIGRGVVRVAEGGAVLEEYAVADGDAYAVALGGPDGHTLFVCVAPTSFEAEAMRLRGGRIDAVEVATPAPGG